MDRYRLTLHDKWFFERHMKDPVTQEPFREGDNIVVCANCKTVHYEDTWGINPNKCCSCCGQNARLNYNTFSPTIFEYDKENNSSFRIIEKKLTFVQRIKLFNAYPIAYTIIVLMLVALIMFGYFSGQYENTVVFNTVSAFGQESVENLKAQGTRKLDGIAENIYINWEEISPKLENAASTSFEEVIIKVQNNPVGEKMRSIFLKFKPRNSYAKVRVINIQK